MGIEELKKDWEALDQDTKQHTLSGKQIKTVIKSRYRFWIYKTFMIESCFLLVYLYFIALTVFRFEVLEKSYLEVLAVISIVLLVLSFIGRIVRLGNILSYSYLNYSYSGLLEKLAHHSIRIQKFYLLNIILGFFLLIALIILNIKIYNEYDLIQSQSFWIILIPVSLFFTVVVNQWIRKYYKKAIDEAEELLSELSKTVDSRR